MILSKLRGRFLANTANGNLFRNMAKMLLGTGVARLIGILSIPILTRIYSPTDYGILAVFTSLISIIAPILTLRYIMALPLPRTDAMAIHLLVLCGVIMLTMSSLVTVVFFFFGDVLFTWMSVQLLSQWWWLVIIGAIAVALYEAMTLWATRKQSYTIIAQTKVIQSLIGETTKIILGLVALKPLGLLIGNVLEQSAGFTSFFRRFKNDLLNAKVKIKKQAVFFSFSYYSSFPFFRLPSQFLLVFSMQAPVMFSAALYGASTTGQLGLALMALALPVSLIANSVGQVFYGEIARLPKGSEHKIKTLVYTVQKKLFIFGLPVTLVILLFGEQLFSFAFGNNWATAGEYAALLSPFVLLQLTSTPLIQILNIYKSQLLFLIINILRISGLLLLYAFCNMNQIESKEFVTLLSLFQFLFYTLISFYIIYFVNKSAKRRQLMTINQKVDQDE